MGNDVLDLAMPLQRLLQKALSCCFVPGFGHVTFQDLPFVIDCAPQIMRLAFHLHVKLVNVPLPMPETAHPAYALPLDVGRE